MRTRAVARFVRLSPRKAKLVLDQIRGKPVGEALAVLDFTPRAAARLIQKVLRSAIANAEQNHQVRNLDDLYVAEAIADGGPRLKRVQPRAMGRAFFIRHLTSHLTVGVTDETAGAPVSRATRTARRAARTSGDGKDRAKAPRRTKERAAK
jgi:large subunit ribosomal protein L22